MNRPTLAKVLRPFLGCCVDCPTRHPGADEDQAQEVEAAALAWFRDLLAAPETRQAFKDAWETADERGETGGRVWAGLTAIADLIGGQS